MVLEHWSKETKFNQTKRKQKVEEKRSITKSGDEAKNEIVETNLDLPVIVVTINTTDLTVKLHIAKDGMKRIT